MSSPTRLSKSPVGIREGTRVILREITATLQNSPPAMSPGKKTVTDAGKLPEHEVKVNFAREFTDAPPAETPSISSACSFQSLTSTLSTKSSSPPLTPSHPNKSYTNLEVSGLDDLISACAGIRLEDTLNADQSLVEASFTSASDEPLDQTTDLPNDVTQSLEVNLDGTQVLSGRSSPLDPPQDSFEPPILNNPEIIPQNLTITVSKDHGNSPEYRSATESFLQTSPSAPRRSKTPELNQTTSELDQATPELHQTTAASSIADSTYQKISNDVTFNSDCSSLPTLPSVPSGVFKEPFPVKDSKRKSFQPKSDETDASISLKIPETSNHHISAITEPTFVEGQKDLEISEESIPPPEDSKDPQESAPSVILEEEDPSKPEDLSETASIEDPDSPKTLEAPLEDTSDPEELDRTITLQETDDLEDVPESEQYEAFKPQRQSTEFHPRPFPPIPTPSDYTNFLPKRQSTGLSDVLPPPNDFQSDLNHCQEQDHQDPQEDQTPAFVDNDQRFFDAEDITPTNDHPEPSAVFEKLRLEADAIANQIINASLEITEDDNFTTAQSNELFKDPSSFDFFEAQTSAKSSVDRLRESLFIKFDPLVSNVSMLPQGNTASPPNDERNGEKDSVPDITTPKRNPAIAAIDRLLFYSPMPSTIEKHEEKIEEKSSQAAPVVDSAMQKELELVRSTVLQLEEQLEKEKVEREKERKEAEKQRESFLETISQLQKQLAQEVKSKNQINVVVDEYEKSISRLVAERERDKKSLDGEKSVLMEELQETKDHLMASEAAFNDVHAKYERLKVVVTALRSNESALKESLAENVEIIKALENRYEQIKSHAAARLEKANLDLDAIRKQHESEMVRLRAILRKEELKSNSLNEIVEQKTKENKELTQILDEVIARVGAKSDD